MLTPLGRHGGCDTPAPAPYISPMPDRGAVIETHGLTRRLGGRAAVDGVDLRVPGESVYGFLGPNGAGKTTTIRLLLGLLRPDGGEVQLFGEPFSRDALRSVGSLVESPSLYPHLTGRENLEVTRRLLGTARAAIDRALEISRLQADANRLVRDYSLGMKQRLGLALALLNEPRLLVLDEPTNGLDPAGIREMRDLLQRLPRDHGVTVFLSSHLLAEVEQVAGFVGIIHEGRLTFQGRLDELRERQKSHLRLGVRRAEAVLELLRASGLAAQADGGAFVRVEAGAREAASVNRLLVESGHDVFHLSVERQSLETIFLGLTNGSTE
jgi:lantibiotic transport system ATP-binding protein